jgi:hypothetical protein
MSGAGGSITRAFRSRAATPGTGGAVAQLGERLNGIQEVSGSIPLGSTILCQLVAYVSWLTGP